MFAQAYLLWKRQSGGDGYENGDGGDGGYDDGDDGYYDSYGGSWWWSPAGMALRYTIVGLLFASVILFFIGGYYHARRRVKKGLQPLPYHRWMVQRRTYDSETRYAQYQQPGQTYVMNDYPAPPPAYSSGEAPPPVYQPPEGGSKILADQHYTQVRPVGESSEARPVGEASEGAGPTAPAPVAR